ncbi:hypothetical protein A3F00_00460 [Candidatus Daviesbacteria bacterium RIFCSPHIGHO2_12_FULL_37_11]|uniref:Uncharacterized protein n=1 Tax=Candidatus Daviesbacteria bacterium RIFCSPHIGHO2_12_FULL_37_11 TaxID=1797777 RepID=A0A1F5KC79_9BACT|nr:MAG: hypothetical protein A2111_02385 [Candidatus Daviesbacteria bacterium GWA1_38_6]OGE17036.1 MAG: hypothetical protein A2769_03080 [Candidatus Daviesbacteria bacterium RIFCSPHIGHO2_01_FULL_37_27]OGE38444.1 MAG: hypothetical protein A3F00_00460 [Candidatus Daviesbacteria bacterium RIFCSPHIGHO2_12_FULL_37_11]OGE45985.1 MAG: hypothetical protein A3B39_04245 [Candidatus Daviesbacteria bacterium RIFCSPLOWO2_01_FULL_37_10]
MPSAPLSSIKYHVFRQRRDSTRFAKRAKSVGIKGICAVFCFIFFSVILNTYYILPVNAQETSQIPVFTSSAYQPINVNSVPPQSPLYANLMVNNLLHAFSCLMAGASPMGQPCVDYLNGVPVISSVNTSGGLLGAVANLNTIVIANPPIRTGQYLATIGDSLGLVKEANAQVSGSGAGVLQPILKLWQVSRNIAYIAMIIIFLIIGLMVMFRQRINPQTVITAQAALPGLVIGLIMITFSYFLASLVTDMSYVATNLVGYYFQSAGATTNTQSLSAVTADKPATEIFSTLINGVFGSDAVIKLPFNLNPVIVSGTTTVYNSLEGLPKDIIDWLIRFGVYSLGSAVGGFLGGIGGLAGGVPGTISALFGGPAGGILANLIAGVGGYGNVLALLLTFVGALMLIYTLFRLLIKLITNYLAIIFLTITAPFHFLAASLPGRQEIAVDWIRNMLCNVLAFPGVLAVFYFVAYLIGPQNSTVFNISGSANIVGGNSLPLFGGLDIGFIRILLAFGALMATPTIPDIICNAVGKVGREGQMIEQEFSQSRQQAGDYQRRLQGGLDIAKSYPDWRTRADIRQRMFPGTATPGGNWLGINWSGPLRRLGIH